MTISRESEAREPVAGEAALVLLRMAQTEDTEASMVDEPFKAINLIRAQALRAGAAALQGSETPVAWRWRYTQPPGRAWSLAGVQPTDHGEDTATEVQPLYAAPPAIPVPPGTVEPKALEELAQRLEDHDGISGLIANDGWGPLHYPKDDMKEAARLLRVLAALSSSVPPETREMVKAEVAEK